MKNSITFLLLLISISAFTQIDLGYNLKKGQVFKIVTYADQNIKQEMMGTETEIKQKITMGIKYEVTNANNGIFDLKCTYYRIVYVTSAMGMEVNYDSENPSAAIDPAAMGFAALLDKSFMLKFNSTGEILEVTGFEEMIDAMIDDMGNLDEITKAATKEQLKMQFGGEQLARTMEQSLKFFPTSGKAKTGETWTITTTLGAYAMDISSDYNLIDYTNKTATISVNSDIESSTFTQNAGSMEMEMEMSGNQSGQYIIDRSSGMLLSGIITQDLTANATTMGMTIPMKIKSENTFTRED